MGQLLVVVVVYYDDCLMFTGLLMTDSGWYVQNHFSCRVPCCFLILNHIACQLTLAPPAAATTTTTTTTTTIIIIITTTTTTTSDATSKYLQLLSDLLR